MTKLFTLETQGSFKMTIFVTMILSKLQIPNLISYMPSWIC